MIRVIHFGASNTFSGAENVICQIITIFRKNPNYEMVYCTPDGPIKSSLEELKIPYFILKKLTPHEIKRAIKEYQPDIIHAHDIRASVLVTISAGKIPIISHVHGNFPEMKIWSLKSYLYRICSISFSHIFWVSRSALNDYIYLKSITTKSSILSNVMDPDLLKRKTGEDTQLYHYDVIYLGRITHIKNPERLIKVLCKVVDMLPNIKIGIIGDGDLRFKTESLAKESNLKNNIEFLGFKDNPLKILHDAKVLVMVSKSEGTPMCALEAMILGVPIVSTPTDGLVDLIDDGITGYLSNDDVELAEKIVKIVSDKKTHDRLSENSIKKSRSLMDLNHYYSTLLSMYEGTLRISRY